MALSPENLLERLKLRRKLTFWRVTTILSMVGLVIALFAASGLLKNFGEKGGDHIARVSISGVISNDRDLLKMLKSLRKNDRVKGVVLAISSPGGTTVGGEAIYEAVRKLADKKPVATSVGTLAASAGYMIACGSDHIVARKTSIVGSIGVIFQYPDASQLLDKVGFAMNEIKSSPLKAEPSPFHPASEEAKQMINKVVRDTYDWFVDLVRERRKFDQAKTLRLADGSVFSGRQSKENGLVDALGDEETARKWVAEKVGNSKLKLVTWKPERPRDNLLGGSALVQKLALLFDIKLSGETAREIRDQLPHRLFVDGLVSMWLNSDKFEE